MLVKELRDVFLVDEFQLGQRLNESLQAEDQHDFALLVSMLSHDVTDNIYIKDLIEKSDDVEENLRDKFFIRDFIEKYAEDKDFVRGTNLTDVFHEQGQGAVNLAMSMKNEPLTPFKFDIPPEVMIQLTPLKQEKLKKEYNGEPLLRPQTKNKSGFLVLEEIDESKKLEAIV